AGLRFAGFQAVDVQLGAGDDVAHVNAVNAPLTIHAGGGNDTMIVSTDPSQVLFGTTLIAGPGDDLMLGGPRNDTFLLGSGNDQVIARDGDDTIVWKSGDGDALVDGGPGTNQLLVNGSSGPEPGSVRPQRVVGARPVCTRPHPA